MQQCDLSEMDQQNRAIVANIELAQINDDIEDYQPKIQNRSET